VKRAVSILTATLAGACSPMESCPDPGPPIPVREGSFHSNEAASDVTGDAGDPSHYVSVDKRIDIDLQSNRVVVRFADRDGRERVETYRIVRP
jgi:hypothetical protein